MNDISSFTNLETWCFRINLLLFLPTPYLLNTLARFWFLRNLSQARVQCLCIIFGQEKLMAIIMVSWLLTRCWIMHFTICGHSLHDSLTFWETFCEDTLSRCFSHLNFNCCFRYSCDGFSDRQAVKAVMIWSDGVKCSDEKKGWLQSAKKRIHQEQNSSVQQG